MVNYKQFESITLDGSNKIKEIQNIRNITKSNSKLFSAYKTVSGPNHNFTVYSNLTVGGASTQEYNTLVGASSGLKNLVTRSDGLDIAAATTSYGGTSALSNLMVSTDGGDNFNIATFTNVLANTVDDMLIVDAFFDGTDWYTVYTVDTNSTLYLWISTSASDTQFATYQLKDINSIYAGKFESGVYKCLIHDASDDFYFVSFTAATKIFTSAIETGLTAPAIWSINNQQYWQQNNTEFIIDKDHFFVSINSADWVPYIDAGTDTNGIVWDFNAADEYKINFLIWKDTIYKILPSGLPVKIQQTVDEAFTGFEDWFSNGTDTIYLIDDISLGSQLTVVVSELYNKNIIQIRTIIKPFEQQYIIIDDKDGNTIFEGYIDSYITNSKDYLWKCNDPVEWDLKTKVNKSYITKTAHYILKDIFDIYGIYIWYDAGISTDPATTYTIDFKDKRVLDVMRWADSAAGLQTSIRATHEVFWDDYIDSGSSILENGPIVDPILEPLTGFKYGRYIIYGAYVDGVRLISESIINPSFATYIDEFPEIDNQSDLDAIRTQLETDWNLTIKKLTVSLYENGFIETGTEVTVTLTEQYGITAETWYVIASTYDAIEDRCYLQLTDATAQPSLKDGTNTDIYNLRQDVGTTAVNVATNITNIDLKAPIADPIFTGTLATGTGAVSLNGDVTVATGKTIDSADEDLSFNFGRARAGFYTGATADYAYFGHRDVDKDSYAMRQSWNGWVTFNAATGSTNYFRINNQTIISYNGNGLTMAANKTLTLSGAPTVDLHAATKKYVDDNIPSLENKAFTRMMEPQLGAIKGWISSNFWKNGGIYFPASDTDCRAMFQFYVPSYASGTFTLHVLYFTTSSSTYSGRHYISAYAVGETPSSDNILSASFAYDLTAPVAFRYYEMVLPGSGIAAEDFVQYTFQSDASNAQPIIIHDVWVEWN